MPFYQFHHPRNEKNVIDVLLGMNDDHSYTDEKGVKWVRVWTRPNAAVDTKANPYSEQDFVRNTGNKKGSIEDVWERSAEMSEKRANKNGGVDPIKEKYFAKEKKRRKGKPCSAEIKDRANRIIKI